MSSNAYERPMHAVPALPEVKARFARAAYLKELRGRHTAPTARPCPCRVLWFGGP